MGKFINKLKQKNELFLIMRLTDDYIVFSNKKSIVKDIVAKLRECSRNNNFQFNNKKLRANFNLDGFKKEESNT